MEEKYNWKKYGEAYRIKKHFFSPLIVTNRYRKIIYKPKYWDKFSMNQVTYSTFLFKKSMPYISSLKQNICAHPVRLSLVKYLIIYTLYSSIKCMESFNM